MIYILLLVAIAFSNYAAYKLGKSKSLIRQAYSKLWVKYKELYSVHVKTCDEYAITMIATKIQSLMINNMEKENEHLKNGIIKCEVK
jgi:hypothetical protein